MTTTNYSTLVDPQKAARSVSNFNNADIAVMEQMVQTATTFIQTYCNRWFFALDYDELYNGTGDCELMLNHYPVNSISSVKGNPVNALMFYNKGWPQVSLSYTSLSPTTLTLNWTLNGIPASKAYTLTDYATIGDLANQLTSDAQNNVINNQWTFQALAPYTTYPVTEMAVNSQGANWTTGAFVNFSQGAMDASRGTSYFIVYDLPFWQFRLNPNTGSVVSPLGWIRGFENYRVRYNAGYNTIPMDLQQVCIELAVGLYLNRGTNPFLKSESALGEYSYTKFDKTGEDVLDMLSPISRDALQSYCDISAKQFKPY